jgi:hypothetical protein
MQLAKIPSSAPLAPDETVDVYVVGPDFAGAVAVTAYPSNYIWLGAATTQTLAVENLRAESANYYYAIIGSIKFTVRNIGNTTVTHYTVYVNEVD